MKHSADVENAEKSVMVTACCETCGWEKEYPTPEEAKAAAQEHQDEKHEPMELTFCDTDEWVQ